MTIGERIKDVRKRKKMTQKQVSALAGMPDSALRKYESGKQIPKLKTLQRIAAALDVEILELVPEEENNTPWMKRTDKEQRELLEATDGDLLLAKIAAACLDMTDEQRVTFFEFLNDVIGDGANAVDQEKNS